MSKWKFVGYVVTHHLLFISQGFVYFNFTPGTPILIINAPGIDDKWVFFSNLSRGDPAGRPYL